MQSVTCLYAVKQTSYKSPYIPQQMNVTLKQTQGVNLKVSKMCAGCVNQLQDS